MNHRRSILAVSMASIMLLTLCAVCATTTVSAVSNGKALAGTGPAASGWATSTNTGFDMFYVGATDRAIYFSRYQDGSQASGPLWTIKDKSLGGTSYSSPASISRFSSLIEVFVTGDDGALYYKASGDGGGKWNGWIPETAKGAVLRGTGPAVCQWSTSANTGFYMFYIRASDRAICYSKYQDGTQSTASTWLVRDKSLGGKSWGSPAAATKPSDVSLVAVRGDDGALYYKTANILSADAWTKWYKASNLGTMRSKTASGANLVGTGPAVCGITSGERQDGWAFVYLASSNRAPQFGTIVTTTLPSSWTSLGGSSWGSPAVMYRWYNVFEVVVRGDDGYIYYQASGNGGQSWNGWIKETPFS